MFSKENRNINHLPLYEVEELNVQEALLELAAEKASLLQKVEDATPLHTPQDL